MRTIWAGISTSLTLALLAPGTGLAEGFQPCSDDQLGEHARCGTVAVPEDRSIPDGRQIELSIVVLESPSATASDPIFLLAGGPGQAATDLAGLALGFLGEANKVRDIVLMDQRGTGGSNRIDCPISAETEPQAAFGNLFDPAGVAECLETVSTHADVRHYNTLAVAHDLEDVRQALGYSRLILRGGSGGTRTALVYMREYPDHVAAALLDGVAPTIVRLPAGFATAAQQAIHRVFDDCAAQTDCAVAFPELRNDFEQLLNSFDDGPVGTSISTPDGVNVPVQMARGDFAYSVRGMLYSTRSASELPRLIHQAATTGDIRPFAQAHWQRQVGLRSVVAMGPHFASYCSEDIPFVDYEQHSEKSQGTFLRSYLLDQYAGACANWSAQPISEEQLQPVSSDVPVLLFSGYYDPSTPPAYGELVAATLSNSRHIVVRNAAHGAEFGCGRDVAIQFLIRGSLEGLGQACEDAGPAEFSVDAGTS